MTGTELKTEGTKVGVGVGLTVGMTAGTKAALTVETAVVYWAASKAVLTAECWACIQVDTMVESWGNCSVEQMAATRAGAKAALTVETAVVYWAASKAVL